MSRIRDTGQLASLASLHDPTRRLLYELVAEAGRPVGRDEAAAAVDVSRALAAYHLDTLVDQGLLVASFARPAGRRGGPGAGRPAKHYEPSGDEYALTVPPRDYELAAELLARAVDADPEAVRPALSAAARERGQQLVHGAEAGSLAELLDAQGFEPYVDDHDVLRLRNCPFHRLAQEHTELVCGMNLALMEGVLDAAGVADRTARLEPRPDRCCVAFPPVEAD